LCKRCKRAICADCGKNRKIVIFIYLFLLEINSILCLYLNSSALLLIPREYFFRNSHFFYYLCFNINRFRGLTKNHLIKYALFAIQNQIFNYNWDNLYTFLFFIFFFFFDNKSIYYGKRIEFIYKNWFLNSKKLNLALIVKSHCNDWMLLDLSRIIIFFIIKNLLKKIILNVN